MNGSIGADVAIAGGGRCRTGRGGQVDGDYFEGGAAGRKGLEGRDSLLDSGVRLRHSRVPGHISSGGSAWQTQVPERSAVHWLVQGVPPLNFGLANCHAIGILSVSVRCSAPIALAPGQRKKLKLPEQSLGPLRTMMGRITLVKIRLSHREG